VSTVPGSRRGRFYKLLVAYAGCGRVAATSGVLQFSDRIPSESAPPGPHTLIARMCDPEVAVWSSVGPHHRSRPESTSPRRRIAAPTAHVRPRAAVNTPTVVEQKCYTGEV
jgi:hypothetical protein